ncbi:hypothetical protein Poli38472_004759 [Pythium oligandrum]|uniref:Uncharacterized protein n=1 Tax=Pythium oligandrum TaxID=41045 RepID=A0A8K1CBC7_PYTOL|nr:hypothetical protein Poli38472_004759 [Pythium oligandrum]|eukprot:TMW59690.1 hypothetical protein Poli38472_004759 [Pythium oligandrum]
MDTAIDVLQKIWGVYKEIKDGQDQFHATYSRLQELLEQLRDMEARDALVQSQLLTKYVGIARRFLAYLQRYSERNFLSKVIKQGQMLEAVAEFNEELEALFQTFHLAMGAHIVEKGRLQEEQMNELMRGVRILLQGKDTSGERWTKQEDDSSEHHAILTRMCSQVNLAQASSDFHALIWFLRNGEDEQKEQAALALWELCDEDASHIDTLVDLECIEPLVSLLIAGTEPSKVYAAKALRCIAVDEDKEAAVVNAGAIPMLVALLRSGSPEQKDAASGALWNVSCMMRHKSMVSSAGAIPLLVNLLRSGSDAQKWHAASALRELAMDARCRVMIAAAGGIVALIKLLHSGTVNQCDAAVEALWNLSLDEKNKRQIASVGGIEALVEQVKSGETDEHRQRAASALTVLAQDDMNDIKIGAAGGIEALVLLLRDGNEGQKNSAAWALSALTDNDDNKRRVVAADGISVLLSAISGGSVIQAEKAVHALRDVTELEENHGAVVENGVIVALVTLLEDVASTPSQKQHAAHALFHLSKNSSLRPIFFAANASGALIAAIHNGGETLREYATGTMRYTTAWCDENESNGAVDDEGASEEDNDCEDYEAAIRAKIVESNGISVLLQCLRTGTDVEKEHAVHCLRNLREAQHIAYAGAIEDLLNLLRGGSVPQQEGAAGVISQISFEENFQLTLIRSDAIEAVIDIMNGISDKLMDEASEILAALSSLDEFGDIVANCNGLEPILEVLRAGSNLAQENTSLVLGNLALNDDMKQQMVDLGALELYVELLSSDNDTLSDRAAFALRNLAWGNSENQTRIVDAGGMEALLEVLKTGNLMIQKQRAAEALSWLATVEEYAIRLAPLAIEALIDAMNDDDNSEEIKEAATDALLQLSVHTANIQDVVKGGSIQVLLKLMQSDVDSHQSLAMDALLNITREESVCPQAIECGVVPVVISIVKNGSVLRKQQAIQIIRNITFAEVGQPFIDAGAIGLIVNYMKEASPGCRTSSAGAMWNIALYCEDGVRKLVDGGAVEQLVEVMNTGIYDREGFDDSSEEEEEEEEEESCEEEGDEQDTADDEETGGEEEDEEEDETETGHAASALTVLCSSEEFGSRARKLALAAGVIEVCVRRMSQEESSQLRSSVIKLIAALGADDLITSKFLAAGAVAPLLELLSGDDEDLCENAAHTLAVFAQNRPCRALLFALSVIDVMDNLAKNGTEEQQAHAKLAMSRLQAEAY